MVASLWGTRLASLGEAVAAVGKHYDDRFAVIGVLAGAAVGVMATAKYITALRGLEAGKEHGEARFAAPDEVSRHISLSPDEDKILSQNIRMTIDDRKTGLNASALVIGGSGSGKTFRYIVPNILQANSSLVIMDSKGTMLRDYGNYLAMRGYRIQVLNISNPYASDSMNPFLYITSPADITKLIQGYIRNTTPKSASEPDPFWPKSEAILMTALFKAVMVLYPREESVTN